MCSSSLSVSSADLNPDLCWSTASADWKLRQSRRERNGNREVVKLKDIDVVKM